MLSGFLVGHTLGSWIIGAGLFRIAIAKSENAAREHFSGYRSHATLLAAIAGLIGFGAYERRSPCSDHARGVLQSPSE